MNNRISYKKIIYWLIICLLAFLIHWYRLGQGDEGIILTGSWRIYQGQTPYLDFFDFITPGSFYMIAFIFKIFGATYLIAKLFAILFLIFSTVGIFLISKEILKNNRYIYLIPIIWLIYSEFYPLINHNQFAGFLSIWVFYFFLKAYKLNSNLYYIILGIFSGLTFWFLQTRGAVIVLIIAFLTLIYNFKNLKKLLYLFLSLLLTLLPFLFWPLPLLYYNLVKFPFIHYLPANQLNYYFLFYVLIIYLTFFFALRIYNQKKELLFLWWLGLILTLSTFHRSDPYHIIINSWPLIIIAFYALESNSDNKIRAWILFGLNAHITLALIIILIISRFYILTYYCENKNFYDWISLKNNKLDKITEYVKNNTNPDDYIYAGPYMPNLYFESKRNNPTRFNILFSTHHPKDFFREAAQDLKQKTPRLVLLNYKAVEEFFHDKNNLVDNYIWENYELDQELFGVQILKLKPSP